MQPRGTGPTLVAVTVAQSIVALIFVCLRTWVRTRLLRGLKYDDYILWVTLFSLFGFTGDTIGSVYYGLGRPSAEISQENWAIIQRYIFAIPVILSFSLFVSKAAIVAFLLSIVVDITHRIILWVSIAILGVLSILEFVGLFVQCFPVQANWDDSLHKECHFNVTMVGYLLTCYGPFLDFFLAMLPWFFFSGLHVTRKERFVVCISLSTGVFAGACGIVRATQIFAFTRSTDARTAVVGAIIWNTTESCVSIICLCLTVTRKVYRRYRKGVWTGPDSTRDSTRDSPRFMPFEPSDRSQHPPQNQTSTNTSVSSDDNVDLGEQRENCRDGYHE